MEALALVGTLFFAVAQASPAEPPASAERILIVLSTVRPREFDSPRFRSALTTYLQNLPWDLAEVEGWPEDDASCKGLGVAMARGQDSGVAVWLLFGSQPWQVGVRAADARRERATMQSELRSYDVSDGSHYRALAVKINTAVRALLASRTPVKPARPVSLDADLPPPRVPAISAPASSFQLALELSGRAATSTAFDEPTFMPGITLIAESGKWSYAVTAGYGLPHSRPVAGGTMDSRSWRWGVALQRVLLGQPEDQRWHLLSEFGGALTLLQSDPPGAGSSNRVSAPMPTVGVAVLAHYPVTRWLAFVAGPELDVFLSDTRPFIGNTRAFSSGWGRLGLDLRLRIRL